MEGTAAIATRVKCKTIDMLKSFPCSLHETSYQKENKEDLTED